MVVCVRKVIWHDVINNTITPFKQTKASPVPELSDILLQYKDRIAAIVYIKRFGAPLCLEDLRSTGIVVIDDIKQLISHRNRKNYNLINEFSKLHLCVVAEARILFALWRKRDKLELFGPRKFFAKRLIKKRKPSQKKRKKAAAESLSEYFGFSERLLDPLLVGRLEVGPTYSLIRLLAILF